MPRQVSSPETKTAIFGAGQKQFIFLPGTISILHRAETSVKFISYGRFEWAIPKFSHKGESRENQGGQGKKMKGRGIKGVGKEIKRDEGIKGSSRGEKVFNQSWVICGFSTGSGGLGSVRFRFWQRRHLVGFRCVRPISLKGIVSFFFCL